MDPAAALALVASGVLLLVGLLTGVWKYAQMWTREDASAHYYVNTAHRASLLYSFAALVLYQFAVVGRLPQSVEIVAVAVPLFFFAFAIGTYVLHGVFEDTDNQFREPYVLGGVELPSVVVHGSMAVLILGEVGGVAVLLLGVFRAVS